MGVILGVGVILTVVVVDGVGLLEGTAAGVLDALTHTVI